MTSSAIQDARRPVRCLAGCSLAVALVLAYACAANGAATTVTAKAGEPITPIHEIAADPDRAALGAALFADARLSHGNRRACAACHDTRSNGADGKAKDTAMDGSLVAKNTNTVFNAALSFRLDWVGDAATLEDQAELALQSPSFMEANWPEVLDKLKADPALVARFVSAYGTGPERASVLDAIATYERTLLTPASRFDLLRKATIQS